MSNLSKAIDDEVAALTRLRDEVRLQLHLGKAEAKDAFDQLEARWPEVEAKAAAVRDASSEGAHDVAEVARNLAHELRSSYEELRRKLAHHA
jgi:predicted  nucleic acid-binding Zn-ribbon protein